MRATVPRIRIIRPYGCPDDRRSCAMATVVLAHSAVAIINAPCNARADHLRGMSSNNGKAKKRATGIQSALRRKCALISRKLTMTGTDRRAAIRQLV